MIHRLPEKIKGKWGGFCVNFLKKDLQKKDKCGIINPKMRF